MTRREVGQRVDRGFGILERAGLGRLVRARNCFLQAQRQATRLQLLPQLLHVRARRRSRLQLVQQPRGSRQLALLDRFFRLPHQLASRRRHVPGLRRDDRGFRSGSTSERVLGIQPPGDGQELALEQLGVARAGARFLLQAFRDGLDQRIRDVGDEALDRARLLADDLPRDVVEVVAAEGLPARQQLVGHGAHGKNVAAGIHRLAGNLLGRHVLRRADDHAGHRHARRLVAMRDAEIEEAQHARALGDQQVGGLHVAMDDAALVGVTEAGTELREPVHLARQRHLLAAANDLRHRPAGDELHRQVRIALVLTRQRKC